MEDNKVYMQLIRRKGNKGRWEKMSFMYKSCFMYSFMATVQIAETGLWGL